MFVCVSSFSLSLCSFFVFVFLKKKKETKEADFSLFFCSLAGVGGGRSPLPPLTKIKSLPEALFPNVVRLSPLRSSERWLARIRTHRHTQTHTHTHREREGEREDRTGKEAFGGLRVSLN